MIAHLLLLAFIPSWVLMFAVAFSLTSAQLHPALNLNRGNTCCSICCLVQPENCTPGEAFIPDLFAAFQRALPA